MSPTTQDRKKKKEKKKQLLTQFWERGQSYIDFNCEEKDGKGVVMIIAYAIKPPFFFVTFHPISILGQGWIKIGNLFDDEIREIKKKKISHHSNFSITIRNNHKEIKMHFLFSSLNKNKSTL